MNAVQHVLAKCGVRREFWKWRGSDLVAVYERWHSAPEFVQMLLGLGFDREPIAELLRSVYAPPLADYDRWGSGASVYNAAVDISRAAPEQMLVELLRKHYPLKAVAEKFLVKLLGG